MMLIRFKTYILYSYLLCVILLIFTKHSDAQYYFGQNKVQYSSFDWQVLTSEHFEVYFYPEEQEVAEAGAMYAEMAYEELSATFGLVIDKKIPFIIYSSPAYFGQTNIIPGLLPENVGGFTEFLKERVVVPFNGSHDNFRRVIKHELVHVFTFRKLYDVTSMRKKLRPAAPPLWFTEGIAEYYSQRKDAPQVDMIVGDLYLSGRPISLIDMYYLGGSYPIYKLGQAFCIFVSENYGEDKLMLLFDNWHKGKNFEIILESTLGEPFEEIDSKWIYSQKKKYFPMLTDGDLPQYFAEKLTKRGYNVKPAVYKKSNGDKWIIFKANRMGYSGIYGKKIGSSKVETFIKGERSSNYESLHLLESSISVSKDGYLAFVSKKKERDHIYIYDLNRRKELRNFSFKSLVRISSPDWGPDGKRLVFSGIKKSGNSDIYICDAKGEQLKQLVDDIYLDTSAKFSPDGNKIAFSSDRGEWGQYGKPGIYLYDLEQKNLLSLVDGDAGYYSPAWSTGGDSLLFIRDIEGSTNIYMLTGIKSANLNMIKLTDIPTGAFDPLFLDDSGTILFSAYSEGAFNLYSLSSENYYANRIEKEIKPHGYFSSWQPPRLEGRLKKGIFTYRTKYSLDIAQSAIAYDAVVGPIGGLQFALTDMLGDHQYYFVISNSASRSRDFVKSFNVAVTYFNREKRINWGMGAYRFDYNYYNEYDGDYSEKQTGIVGLVAYPISRYQRLEFNFYLRQYEKEYIFFEDKISGIVLTPYVSYVKDVSLWERTGPLDGHRLNLTVGFSYNLETGEQFSRIFLGDFRKYYRISTLSCFATRLFYVTSAGRDPQRLYLGGSWSLRGYGFRSDYGRNIFLTSSEIRFPLINALFVGFPVGNFDFRAIRGALFFDAGDAWDEEFERLRGSFGLGARVNLGAFIVLRFDFAHRTDFKTVSQKTYFDFFFGWNF